VFIDDNHSDWKKFELLNPLQKGYVTLPVLPALVPQARRHRWRFISWSEAKGLIIKYLLMLPIPFVTKPSFCRETIIQTETDNKPLRSEEFKRFSTPIKPALTFK